MTEWLNWTNVLMLELDHKEDWEPKNECFQTVVLEKTLENPLDSKEIKPVNPKGNLSWIFIGRTDAEAEAPVLWPPILWQRTDSLEKPWCWERLKAGGEGDERGWNGWMASLTQWTWVWASSRSWLWTGKPGMLLFMGSQRVRHDWVTEVNWIELAILWNSAFKWVYLSFSPLPFSSLLFTAICKSTSAFFYCQLF